MGDVAQLVDSAARETNVVHPGSGVTAPDVVMWTRTVAKVFRAAPPEPAAAEAEGAAKLGTTVLLSTERRDAAPTARLVRVVEGMVDASMPDMNPALERISAAPMDTLAIATARTIPSADSTGQTPTHTPTPTTPTTPRPPRPPEQPARPARIVRTSLLRLTTLAAAPPTPARIPRVQGPARLLGWVRVDSPHRMRAVLRIGSDIECFFELFPCLD